MWTSECEVYELLTNAIETWNDDFEMSWEEWCEYNGWEDCDTDWLDDGLNLKKK